MALTLDENEPVWVFLPDSCWSPAIVVNISKDTDKVTVRLEENQTEVHFCKKTLQRVTAKPLSVETSKVLPRCSSLNEQRLDDLTGLVHLHEAAVLNTIRSRYSNDDIYTYSGIVLTSVNPYYNLDIYGPEIVWAYYDKKVDELSPHLYAIAERARSSLSKDKENQTIIISGESGAGKTISAKYIMRYLAEVCSTDCQDLFASQTFTDDHSIEASILATNPILEAFGNAKTARNDNSSRFGKYIQIYYHPDGKMAGACIKTYLLEKTRVVGHASQERGFHIFYQLLAGLSKEFSLRFRLTRNPSDFEYLKSEEVTIKNVDDANEFQLTRKSLLIAGMDDNDQEVIFQILAAILHLGNVDFIDNDSDGAARLTEKSRKSLEIAAELLGVPMMKVENALLTRNIVVAGDSIQAKNNLEHSCAVRDAIAKLLYFTVFNHIVERLNEKLKPQGEDCKLFIGVLDIYGFEKFEQNYFEQFCINYANEKLQGLFTKQMFKLEQELYAKEGLDWSFVDFHDNERCIELIEGKLGILELLDEECRFPNGSDSSFLSKLLSNRNTPELLSTDRLAKDENFTLGHFAYTVRYNVKAILEKNRDTTSVDLLTVLSLSTVRLIRTMSEERLAEQVKSKEGTPRKRQHTGRGGAAQTTGLAFKNSLDDLLAILSTTKTHYIRCVKPNELKQAATFDAHFVLQQLRACGVLETIRISAAGYPGRWKFAEFLERFEILKLDFTCDNSISERDRCQKLLCDLELSKNSYQIGKNKIFMRSGVLAVIEEKRLQKLRISSLQIQGAWKLFHIAELMLNMRSMSTLIQSIFKAKLARALAFSLKKERSTLTISNWLVMYRARKDRRRNKLALQIVLGFWMRREINRRVAINKTRQASAIISNFTEMVTAKRLYHRSKHIATSCHLAILRKTSMQALKQLKIESKSLVTIKATADQLREQLGGLALRLKDTEVLLANEKLRTRDLTSQLLDAQCSGSAPSPRPGKCSECLTMQELLKSLEQSNQDLFAKNEILSQKVADSKRQIKELEAVIKDFQTRLSKATIAPATLSTSPVGIPPPQTLIKESLSQPAILKSIADTFERARIPITPEERAAKTNSRLPFRLLERWTSACIEADVEGPTFTKSVAGILGSIRGICAAAASSNGTFARLHSRGNFPGHHSTSGSMVDRKFSFWIANLFDYASFLQWAVGELNDKESSVAAQSGERHNPSNKLLTLLQIRMDVTRLIEHLYRAWLSDLMRFFGKLGVMALLDHQGLTGFAAEDNFGDTNSNTLKNIIMPLAKLASARFAELESERSVDDLVDCLEDLADAVEASHMQSELVGQLFSAIMSHICASAFNQLLIRKNYATWKRGIQIQFNISRLEEWATSLQSKNPGYYFSTSRISSPIDNNNGGPLASAGLTSSSSPIWQVEPLIQAVKLLQLAKTTVASDLELLFEACPRLTISQIRKILSIYVPDAFEDGPVSQDVLQGLTKLIVNHEKTDAFAEPKAQEIPLQLSVRPLPPTIDDNDFLKSQLPDGLSRLLAPSTTFPDPT